MRTVFGFRFSVKPVGRESEAHPAFGNRVRPDLCQNIFAPLFLAACSSSRSRCWNAAFIALKGRQIDNLRSLKME